MEVLPVVLISDNSGSVHGEVLHFPAPGRSYHGRCYVRGKKQGALLAALC